MAAVVKNYYGGSWVDISDYIDNIGEVSMSFMNADMTLKANTLKLDVAVTIRDVRGSNFKFVPGDKFACYVDGALKWQGYVDFSEYKWGGMFFEVELKNIALALADVIVDYDSLYGLFSTSANWWEFTSAANNAYGNTVVGVTWAMECIFNAVNLNLVKSTVDDIYLFKGIGFVTPVYEDVLVYFKDLVFIAEILWCLNQPVAVEHSVIDNAAKDYNRNKVNGFNFVSDILSSLRLIIKQTAIDEFTLYRETANYNIADDDKFEYAQRDLKNENTLNTISLENYTYPVNALLPYVNTVIYKDSSPTTIVNNYIGKGETTLLLPSNFRIFYSNAKNYANHYGQAHSFGPAWRQVNTGFILPYGVDDYEKLNIMSAKVRAAVLASDEEKILTNYQSAVNTVKEHDIDLEWENSNIVQETFDE